MRKTIIILSVFVLVASSCGRTTKEQMSKTENILLTDTIETIISDTSENIQTSNIDCDHKILTIKHQYKFEDFPVEIYRGKLSLPDFNSNTYASEMGFVEEMTHSCEREGINFAGRFTILQGDCGTFCTFIILIDRKNGQFVTIKNPNGYEDESGAYGYEYRKDSRLLIANSNLFTDDEFEQSFSSLGLKPKYYVWKNDKFVLLK